jgi:two-component system, chemotaxis family, response regulator Rcp1
VSRENLTLATTIEILLVEDDPASVQLTTEAFEALQDPKFPYQIRAVQDGEEALSFLRREPPYANAPRPDLILLDLNLPKIDGRALLATIKADSEVMDIPIVVLSCSSDPADVKDAYRHQVAGYITKSTNLGEYLTAIRSVRQLWFKVVTLPKAGRAGAV